MPIPNGTTIVLYDPYPTGHHPMYFRLITKQCLDLNLRVVALCSRDKELTHWLAKQAAVERNQLLVLPVDPPPPSKFTRPLFKHVHNALRAWWTARRDIKRCLDERKTPADCVYFLWLDAMLAPFVRGWMVQLVFPWKWAGLWFHPTFYRKPTNPEKDKKIPAPIEYLKQGVRKIFQVDAALSAPSCAGVALLDEGVADRVARRSGKPVVTFPDFTDTAEPDMAWHVIREIKERAAGRKIIGLIGEQSRRKGLLTFLDAVRLCEERPWFFVCAGRPYFNNEPETDHPFIHAPPESLYTFFDSIPGESQFNALIKTCDVLFAAYRDFRHSSNLIVKAATFKKPIIVSHGFLMSQRVQQYRLGGIVGSEDPSEIRDKIEAMLDPDALQAWRGQAGFEEYRKQHSLEALRDALARLCQCAAQQTHAEKWP